MKNLQSRVIADFCFNQDQEISSSWGPRKGYLHDDESTYLIKLHVDQ